MVRVMEPAPPSIRLHNPSMVLGIDASNLRGGGGVTHLVELLGAADPAAYGFETVIVWAGTATLEQLPDRSWLRKQNHRLLDGPLPARVWWQKRHLHGCAHRESCSLLFVPGGSDQSGFRPVVTMNRSLLPFDTRYLKECGVLRHARFRLLRAEQIKTLERADGVIYLTRHAEHMVGKWLSSVPGKRAVIPHGVSARFTDRSRLYRPWKAVTAEDPFRLLYVSTVDAYKHHVQVIEAVAMLRQQKMPLQLDLYGKSDASTLTRVRAKMREVDPGGHYIRYHGAARYEDLPRLYEEAELKVFASGCETFGQILVEAMASGLPIACSSRSALPEIAGDAVAYFDPDYPREMAAVLRSLMECHEQRAALSRRALARAQAFSWKRCAQDTFSFLSDVASS
jgi:glycosyltransferase involved in cell wall biosynthesis